jgi:hypothetical protein
MRSLCIHSTTRYHSTSAAPSQQRLFCIKVHSNSNVQQQTGHVHRANLFCLLHCCCCIAVVALLHCSFALHASTVWCISLRERTQLLLKKIDLLAVYSTHLLDMHLNCVLSLRLHSSYAFGDLIGAIYLLLALLPLLLSLLQ